MAAQNRQAVNWLGNAWAQVVLSRATQAAPGISIPPEMTPALIDFWTVMADPVVECVERYLTPEDND
jgi:hypothetical protein